MRRNAERLAVIALLVTSLVACDQQADKTTEPPASPTPVTGTTLAEDKQSLDAMSEQKRLEFSDTSFEEFEKSVFREDFEGGKYIVNGDTAIPNRKLLREFYEANIKRKPPQREEGTTEFIIHQVGGLDAIWPDHKKKQLSYCVSTAFGDRYDGVKAAMQEAANAWQNVADIDFVYTPAEDTQCDQNNPRVLFDVRPVNVSGQYLARAFFPNESRKNRNVLIDDSSFRLSPSGKLSLTGILRHELGHTIGARHEHTRPDSGTCFEDNNYKPLTNYDAFSVMHYPHCNGMGDWKLQLTNQDKSGAACVYGAAAGFQVDPNLVNDISSCASSPNTTPAAEPQTRRFANQSVAKGKELRYPDFAVVPGSQFTAEMTGSGTPAGDPDLYLSFDHTPLRAIEFDCRPYLIGADETCDVTVPQGAKVARLMVYGYDNGSFDLTVKFVEPAGE